MSTPRVGEYDDPARLHAVHCPGCSEYGGHGNYQGASAEAFGPGEDYEGREARTPDDYDC